MTTLTATAAQKSAGTDLLSLALDVSDDQKTWQRLVFEGECPAYVDRQAAAWIADRPYLSVQMDEEGECWSLFPRTFDVVFCDTVQRRQLMQVPTPAPDASQ